jgi:hypothetical protein
MDNTNNWNAVDVHLRRHESGCWTWSGPPVEGNVYRLVAQACGTPLPAGQKLYRMPGCMMGKVCVNPHHLGTGADFVLALNGRRQEISEPPRTVTIRLTPEDSRFLKTLRISWE